ncbi:MAG: translation initiation factor IF-2, partial [Candidatus Altiarchaeota archaeon]|nr:translation initiation factor IF-2 [Candidatus Altiarchaeota archaeon]
MSQPLVVVLGHKDHGKTALVSFIRNRAKAVPELRFVDTPGHTEYADLRKETGKLADLAILVVDLKKGIQEQTLESIELLENLNVPFVIAANKLDTIRRYKSQEGSFIGNFRNQDEKAKDTLGKKIKKIIEKLSKLGF